MADQQHAKTCMVPITIFNQGTAGYSLVKGNQDPCCVYPSDRVDRSSQGRVAKYCTTSDVVLDIHHTNNGKELVHAYESSQ